MANLLNYKGIFRKSRKNKRTPLGPPLLSMISMTYTDGTERGDLPANLLFFLLFDLKPKRHKDPNFLNEIKDLGADLVVVA